MTRAGPRRRRCSRRSAGRSNGLGGRYVTAEDVGMSVADMVAISNETKYVAGLPVAEGAVGGDPGPHTSYGVYLGVKAAVKRALGQRQPRRPAHRSAGRGQRRRRAGAPRRRGRRAAQHRRHRPKPGAGAGRRGRRNGRGARGDHDAGGRRAQPQCARRDPDRSIDRRAQRADRRGRREQSDGDEATTATASRRAASSTPPIMSSTRAASSTSRPNI